MLSDFQFVSYKVDSLDLKIAPNLGALETTKFEGDWNVAISFRKPVFFSQRKAYIAGLEAILSYPSKSEPKPDGATSDAQDIVRVRAGITGLFSVVGKLESKVESTLVKFQAPYLLLPFLRGTMTSVLANAGVSAPYFPLVNLHALAEATLKDVEIEVREG